MEETRPQALKSKCLCVSHVRTDFWSMLPNNMKFRDYFRSKPKFQWYVAPRDKTSRPMLNADNDFSLDDRLT